jgi:hypothetical protein
VLFAAVHESGVGTSRSSGDVRPEPARWAKPDIDQVAVTHRDFMSTRLGGRWDRANVRMSAKRRGAGRPWNAHV